MSDDPKPISSDLDDLMRRLQAGDREQVAGVFGKWEEIVGASVAANVTPVRIENQTLVVEVSESSWATQVGFLESTIRQRILEETGSEIVSVEVRVRRHR